MSYGSARDFGDVLGFDVGCGGAAGLDVDVRFDGGGIGVSLGECFAAGPTVDVEVEVDFSSVGSTRSANVGFGRCCDLFEDVRLGGYGMGAERAACGVSGMATCESNREGELEGESRVMVVSRRGFSSSFDFRFP